MELGANGGWAHVVRKMRAFPRIERLLLRSCHGPGLAVELVERLRWRERYRAPVPREWRLFPGRLC